MNFVDTVLKLVSAQETPASGEPTPPAEPAAPVVPAAEPTPVPDPKGPTGLEAPPAPPTNEPTAEPSKAWYESDESTPPAADPVPPTNPAEPQGNEPVSEPEDPDFALLKKFKESGKSLKDLVAEYRVEDVAELPTGDMVRKGLEKFYKLSGEGLEDEIVRYETLSPVQKAEYESTLRSKFEEENSKKLQALIEPLEKKAKENEAAFLANVQRYEGEVDRISTSLVEKEIYGIKVSPEMAETVKKEMLNFGVVKPDGSFDAEKIFEAVFATRFLKDIVRANVTAAKNVGRQEILSEVHNPNPNIPGAVIPTSDSPDDVVRDYVAFKSGLKK